MEQLWVLQNNRWHQVRELKIILIRAYRCPKRKNNISPPLTSPSVHPRWVLGLSQRFLTLYYIKKKGCQMTCDISKRNHTAATVCSPEQVVCHRVARLPSQRNKAQADGLWIKTFPWFCKSLTCLFPLRLLNGEIYILCPARASPACLSV